MEGRYVVIKDLVMQAKVYLQWEDGRSASLGTINIEKNGKEAKIRGLRKFRQRLGWELIRTGFRIMMPGRKWKTEINT